jgi:AcrR family transcriptional regulator
MSTSQPRTYAPRISREESERRIIEATITLLRPGDFNEVSSRKIASLAGVHAPTISRIFGSMTGLFAAVAYELAQRSLTATSSGAEVVFSQPELILRSKLVAWCLANGADPELFRTSMESPGGQALLAWQTNVAPASFRANAALSEIFRFAFEGFAVLGTTHTFTEEQIADVLEMTRALRRALPLLERDLGWDATPGEH